MQLHLAGKSIGRNEKSDTNGLGSDDGVQYTLTGADKHAVAHDLIVRKITPLEAERLQECLTILQNTEKTLSW